MAGAGTGTVERCIAEGVRNGISVAARHPLNREEDSCIRREGTSEAAPEAVRSAVGEGGWGRLLSGTNATEAALAVMETVAGHRLGALEVEGLPPLLPIQSRDSMRYRQGQGRGWGSPAGCRLAPPP